MFGNIFDSLNIPATALSAERQRMNVIANNMANINTTRGPDGQPYRRKFVVFETLANKDSLNNGLKEKGVSVADISEDSRPLKKIYKPGHPDADKDGYLLLPNVDMVEENVDLLAASRAYDANLNVLKASKSMIKKMLDLLTMD